MSLDILNEFTKDEILAWIREKNPLLLRPRRSDLLFIRWQQQSKKLSDAYQAELDRWEREQPDFKRRDELARQFNSETRAAEKLRLLEEIEPFDIAMQDHIARCRKLDRRQEQVDRLYQEQESQRRKEAGHE
ncbi:TPA: hypothetical protein OT313_002499 [Pseudomonas aeruginosa]|nr:hypothetical protein [Pseudomonas aeruginosa]